MSGYTHEQYDNAECTYEEYFRCHECMNCGYDCVVTDALWAAAWGGDPPDKRETRHWKQRKCWFLCRECIERRLGRRLRLIIDMPLCGLNAIHYLDEGWTLDEFHSAWNADYMLKSRDGEGLSPQTFEYSRRDVAKILRKRNEVEDG